MKRKQKKWMPRMLAIALTLSMLMGNGSVISAVAAPAENTIAETAAEENDSGKETNKAAQSGTGEDGLAETAIAGSQSTKDADAASSGEASDSTEVKQPEGEESAEVPLKDVSWPEADQGDKASEGTAEAEKAPGDEAAGGVTETGKAPGNEAAGGVTETEKAPDDEAAGGVTETEKAPDDETAKESAGADKGDGTAKDATEAGAVKGEETAPTKEEEKSVSENSLQSVSENSLQSVSGNDLKKKQTVQVTYNNVTSMDVKLNVVERTVSNSSNFGTVPSDQKTGNVPAENKQIAVDMTTGDVVDYLRFTGTEQPVTKADRGTEIIEFSYADQTNIVGVTDWNNLPITYNNGTSKTTTTTATNFQGKTNSVSFSVTTEVGKKRILDIYVGGHPDTGSYTATATMGVQPLPVTEGSTDAGTNSYSYTPKSSLVTHYQIKYTGTGDELNFKVQLNYTGNQNWAGIGVGGAVLRSNEPTLSADKGNFDKSVSDIANSAVSATLTNLNGLSLTTIKRSGNPLNKGTDYIYEESSGKITFKKDYLTGLSVGSHPMTVELSDGTTTFNYTIVITDSSASPRPYVKDTTTLYNSDLSEWKLWYRDEFDSADGKLHDWWEPSYLKWWNYSSESNEKYNEIYKDNTAVDNARGTDGSVLRQFTTSTMRADSIVTRSDNFRNPGITLGVRDLNHNYSSINLMNYQHMPTDDRGATAYGYFEVRAKITGGTTAKTMSGSTAWWFTGFQDASWQTMEVDMVEYGYGVPETGLNGHFATPNHPWRDVFAGREPRSWDTANYGVPKPADGYHVYGIEWTPTGMNGYFNGELVWSKTIDVNYRMLLWISLNSHAYDTYTTDDRAHYFDYVRIWKTDELVQLEKEMVTKNVLQKLQPVGENVATLAYAAANGISSSHYQKWDPIFFNDNDNNTSFKVMTPNERKTTARTSYNSDEYYLYLDWVKYTNDEIENAAKTTETVTGADGNSYVLASEYDVRRPKTVAAVELVVNKDAGYKTINKANSDNSKGKFVYDINKETAYLFPYKFDIEYSADGYNGWTPIATDVEANWDFNNGSTASFVVNLPVVTNVNHLRIHVKSVWNSNTNAEVDLENGFYIAEVKVYETTRQTSNVQGNPGDYQYNHAVYSTISVTDKDGNAGSADMNFPVTDVADGVYVNEFRSSGDSRDASDGNRVNINKPVTVLKPQYINFEWDSQRTIDNFAMTIGYMNSAPTEFALEYYDGNQWKELGNYTPIWQKDFETFRIPAFDAVTTNKMRVKIIAAHAGPAIDLVNKGVQGGVTVRIAPGYYSIAEIELNETKAVKHTHTLDYAISGTAMTVTCTGGTGTTCPNQTLGTVTVTVPTKKGEAAKADLVWNEAAKPAVTIKYKDAGGMETDTAPTGAGSFTVAVSLEGHSKNLEVPYTIQEDPHQHAFSYEVKGNVMTITCSGGTGLACPNTTLGTVTVTVPARKGEEAKADLVWKETSKPVMTIKYKDAQGTESTVAPAAAGSYHAVVSLAGHSQTLEVPFTIQEDSHQHAYSYATKGNTMTVTCSGGTGTACGTPTVGSVTVTVPAKIGEEAKVSAEWKDGPAPAYTLLYQKADGSALSAAPTEAGSYKAVVTLKGHTQVLTVDFILKAESTGGAENIETPKLIPDASGQYASAEKDVKASDGSVYKLVSTSVDTAGKEAINKVMQENETVKKAFQEIKDTQKVDVEVHLKNVTNGQKVQPTGFVTFILAFPKNTDNSYTFTVLHLEQGTAPKLLEQLAADELKSKVGFHVAGDGIHVTVNTFSPFVIGWKETAAAAPGTGSGQTPGTGTGGGQTPGTGTGSGQTPGTGTGGGQTPGTGTGSGQTPGTGTGSGQTPGTGTGSGQTPGTGTGGSQTPGTGTGGSQTPGTGTGGGQTPGTSTGGSQTSQTGSSQSTGNQSTSQQAAAAPTATNRNVLVGMTPTAAPAATPAPAAATNTAPKTGDDSPVLLMTVLCVGGLGILGYYVYRHKKRKEQE